VADSTHVRILDVVGTAYRDFPRVLAAMPHLVAIAAVIVMARATMTVFVPQRNILIDVIGNLGLDAVESFLLTPVFLAVHRYIILDEVTHGYPLDPRDRRFQRFFVWSVAITAVLAASVAAQPFILWAGLWAGPLNIALVLDFVVLVVLAYMILRLTMLFPAIAIDAAGANASNAIDDTKGYALKIILIFVVASLPLAAIDFALIPFRILLFQSFIGRAVAALMSAVTLLLFVALASRIFQGLADRMLRPAAV
jgi:hypothetical protein